MQRLLLQLQAVVVGSTFVGFLIRRQFGVYPTPCPHFSFSVVIDIT